MHDDLGGLRDFNRRVDAYASNATERVGVREIINNNGRAFVAIFKDRLNLYETLKHCEQIYMYTAERSSELGDVRIELCGLNSAGEAAFAAGEYDRSLQYFENCLTKLSDSHEPQFEAGITYGGLCGSYLVNGRYEQSIESGLKAIKLYKQNQNASKRRNLYYHTLATAYEKYEQLEKAKQLYEELLDLATKESGKKSGKQIEEHIARVENKKR